MRSVLRRWAASAAVVVTLVAPAGCAEPPVPGEAAPRLAQVMARVDDAIATQNWASARKALQRMIDQAAAALEAGTLTEADAVRIQAAALRLLSQLPEPVAAPAAAPTPTPTPDNTPASDPYQQPSEDGNAGQVEAPAVETRTRAPKAANAGDEAPEDTEKAREDAKEAREEAKKEREKAAEEREEAAEEARKKAAEEAEKAAEDAEEDNEGPGSEPHG